LLARLAAERPTVRRQEAALMRSPERRLVALLVGLGVTGIAMLSKLTALFALPGWLLASLVGKFASGLAIFWFTFYVANFIVWAAGTYLFLTLKERRKPAA
jgi:hypothetical protein